MTVATTQVRIGAFVLAAVVVIAAITLIVLGWMSPKERTGYFVGGGCCMVAGLCVLIGAVLLNSDETTGDSIVEPAILMDGLAPPIDDTRGALEPIEEEMGDEMGDEKGYYEMGDEMGDDDNDANDGNDAMTYESYDARSDDGDAMDDARSISDQGSSVGARA